MIKKFTTLFLVAVVVSMIVMQPLQVAQATSNIESASCKIGLALPYYILAIGTIVGGSSGANVASVALFLIKILADNEIVDLIIDVLEAAVKAYAVKKAINAIATLGTSLLVDEAAAATALIATHFAMTACPPVVVSNQGGQIFGGLSGGVGRINLEAEGNEFHRSTFTEPIKCTADPLKISLDAILDNDAHIRLFKNEWGDFNPHPETFYPPAYDRLDDTVQWENNIRNIAFSVEPHSEQGFDDVRFKVGKNSIQYRAHQQIANHIETSNFFNQLIDVKERVKPIVELNGVTLGLETVEPGGIPVPIGILDKIKKNITFLGDDCTPKEKLRFNLRLPETVRNNFMTFGIHDFALSVSDESGNTSLEVIQKVEVEDTIPPDIFPVHNVGITVPTGVSQVDSSQVPLTTPPTFDFGTLEPNLTCTVDNSLGSGVPCDSAVYPIGTSTVTWTSTDVVGNSATLQVLVIVKTEGTNTPPVANDKTFLVIPNLPNEIEISGSDADFDPLVFSIVNKPEDGSFETDIEAIFQTKFSLTGTLSKFTTHLRTTDVDKACGLIFPDSENSRLLLTSCGRPTDQGKVERRDDTSIPDFEGLPFRPDAIVYQSTTKSFTTNPPSSGVDVLHDEFIMADWDRGLLRFPTQFSTGEFGFIGGNYVSIKTELVDPQNMEWHPDGLLITDLKDGGRIVLIGLDGNLKDQWSLQSLGITPDGIAAYLLAPDLYLVTDWPNKRIVILKILRDGETLCPERICVWRGATHLFSSSFSTTAFISPIFHAFNPILDLSNAFSNPPAFPDLVSPRDIFGIGGTTVIVTDDFNRRTLIRQSSVSPLDEIGKSFLEIVILTADNSGKFYTWDGLDDKGGSVVSVFELSGRLVSTIPLSEIQQISDIGADSSGNIFVSYSHPQEGLTIQKFSSTGTFGNFIRASSFDDPTIKLNGIIKVDKNNNVHIGSTFFKSSEDFDPIFKIIQFDNNLNDIIGEIEIQETGSFGDFAIDSQGNYYILELVGEPGPNGRLLKYDSQGNFVQEFDSVRTICPGILRENSVVVDDDDNVYVSDCIDSLTPRIQQFSSDGDLLGVAVPDGVLEEFASFLDKGDFVKINDIAVTKDAFFVAEGERVVDGVLLGKRLHVFESSALVPIAEGVMKATYTPDDGFGVLMPETDQFTFKVNDLFADSNVAQVTINVELDTTLPTIVLLPNSDTFFNSLFPVSTYSNSGATYTTEHFLKPMAYQIVKRYAEVYEQSTGEKIPEKAIETLQETALMIAKRDAMGISDIAENVKLDLKDSGVLHPEMSSEPYLISDSGEITALDGGSLQTNLPSEFNLALYTYEGDYQDGFIMVPSRISSSENSCFPSVTMESDSVRGLPKTNPVLDAVLNLISAEDDRDTILTITNNAPDFLPVDNNVITFTATDRSGNSASCTWEVRVVDTIPPNITSPPPASTEVIGILTPFFDFGIPIVSDVGSEEIISLITNGDLLSLDPSSEDLWDITNGILITDISSLRDQFNESDMFGGSQSIIEPGNTAFDDFTVGGAIHHVEWSSTEQITLRSFALFAKHDQNEFRSFQSFRLYAFNENINEFELISSFNPVIPYQNNPGSSDGTLRIIQNIPQVTASKFRAEFVSPNVSGDPGGPRIIELDGFDSFFQNCTQENDNISCSLPGIENWEIIVSNDSPSEFKVGTTPITWTATDFSGNSATSQQDITIIDNVPPEIETRDDITLTAINGHSNILDYEIPQATDLGGILIETVCTPTTGEKIPIGVTPVSCLAMDNRQNVGIEIFFAIVESPDDDEDNIVKIVDTDDTLFSNQFSDEGLGGTTIGEIISRGDQNLRVIDSPTEDVGITIFAERSTLGINNDFDCKDNITNEIFRGDSIDEIEDECYDSEGTIKLGLTETIDEDPINGIDDDNDGFVDEDPGIGFGPAPGKISVCDGSALISLGAGEAVNITCGSVTVEVQNGSVDIQFTSTGGITTDTTLGPLQSMTFDPETLSITAGPNTDAIITLNDGRQIPISSEQTIANILSVDITPPQTLITSVKDDTGDEIPENGITPSNFITAQFSSPDTDVSFFECAIQNTFVPCNSGDSFGPLNDGVNNLRVRATDTLGNIGKPDSHMFTAFEDEVEIPEDTTPPTISTPLQISEETTSPDGKVITFDVTATDEQDPSPTVSCTPSSGSLFPLGPTTVTCTATDSNGNTSQASFEVLVEPIETQTTAEQIQSLIDDVDSLVPDQLNPRTARSLQWLLNAALSAEEGGDSTTAKSKLTSFESRINLFMNRGLILADVGEPLVNTAQAIIDGDPDRPIITG